MENGIKVYKGTNPEVDSYSVFWDNKKLSDTSLIAQLKSRGVTDVYVCGLAYDVCVGKQICILNSTTVIATESRLNLSPDDEDGGYTAGSSDAFVLGGAHTP